MACFSLSMPPPLSFFCCLYYHRGINVDQHSKPRNKCKYSILYLHFFRGFECWSTSIPRSDLVQFTTQSSHPPSTIHIQFSQCFSRNMIQLDLYTNIMYIYILRFILDPLICTHMYIMSKISFDIYTYGCFLILKKAVKANPLRRKLS